MTVTVKKGPRKGNAIIPASKSQAHRAFICAALSDKCSTINCNLNSDDIIATVSCLNALGANIECKENNLFSVSPYKKSTGKKELFCNESGSTLRFLLPVLGALNENAVINMNGRLSERPIDVLTDLLIENGMSITKTGNQLFCSGSLKSGDYRIPGDISSQFISGLLFALPLLSGDSRIIVTNKTESSSYITLTLNALKQHGIIVKKRDNVFIIPGKQKYIAVKHQTIEGDWSSAAFFLGAGSLSNLGITAKGLNINSCQGDREIINILQNFGADISFNKDGITSKKNRLYGQIIDASGVPDLVPVLSVIAAASFGETKIINAKRLRYKESDRLYSTAKMLNDLGANVVETDDGLCVFGKKMLIGGTVDPQNDHRIAMAAAVAASVCENDVTIKNAECVNKSFPDFWQVLNGLEV